LANSATVLPFNNGTYTSILSAPGIMRAYKLFPKKDEFFLKNAFLHRLAGNDDLMEQIKSGKSENEIRQSWEPALSNFKKIRKKYLLYDDFAS
jgi:uncharacterized protein YbbC (DUF1343 family)